MSRKDAINSIFLKKGVPPSVEGRPARDPGRVRTGAISAMGSSLQELTQGARAAAKLQEQLLTAEHVLGIDPSLIDASPVVDRLPTKVDPHFDDLVASIELHGQQVPILVRPSPSGEGRYQVAYGRRRLRAAAQLGREVRAIVRDLTDDELVVAQGRENLDRADLSFIEKAFFAKHLEDAGYERTVIMAALSTDKSDLSRYIAIARRVPSELARQIGPAAKAGRARWSQLVEVLSKPRVSERLEALIKTDSFQGANSDKRFSLAFGEAVQGRERTSRPQSWNTPEGKRAARILRQSTQTSIVFDDRRVPEFARYVTERLDDLYNNFMQQEETGTGD